MMTSDEVAPTRPAALKLSHPEWVACTVAQTAGKHGCAAPASDIPRQGLWCCPLSVFHVVWGDGMRGERKPQSFCEFSALKQRGWLDVGHVEFTEFVKLFFKFAGFRASLNISGQVLIHQCLLREIHSLWF